MTALADRNWRLLHDEARAGPVQMALEEVAAETALEDNLRTVRVFSWEPSTLSLGYNQDPATVDWDYCEQAGIEVTRRQTGGGGIYHDRHADISYTIVAPAAEVPGDLMACYELCCTPILEALTRMGIEADFAATRQESIYQPACYLREINPAHDVVAADGRKISGNAQYRTRDVVIQHGSISYAREPKPHLEVFEADLEPATFTGRVTSIREQTGIDREEAVSILTETLREWCEATPGEWAPHELENAQTIAANKYDTDAWVRGRTD